MENQGKRSLVVYGVVARPDGKEVWLRLGNAFPNRDGSTTLLLDAVPISGKMQIREYQPRDSAGPRALEGTRPV